MSLELNETVDGMLSEDYVERFRAEYYQLCIRLKKLNDICLKYESGKLDFTPDTPLEVLKDQIGWMEQYKYVLELRAMYEAIRL